MTKQKENSTKKTVIKRKKIKKIIPEAIANVYSSFNNTIVSFSDLLGNVICWSSSGSIGFKGAKKSTPYAAQLVAIDVLKKANDHGVKALYVRINGVGPGKDAALRQFQASGLTIKTIKNVTPQPHNGVRKKKKYRNMI